jgi:hypothetical protein
MKALANLLSAVILTGFIFGAVAFMTIAGAILAPVLAVLGVVVLIYALLQGNDDEDEDLDEWK